MKAKDKKRFVYTVRIDEELKKALDKRAKKEDISNAKLIRKAISEYLNKQ